MCMELLPGETAVVHHISRFTGYQTKTDNEIEIISPILPKEAEKLFFSGDETGLNFIGARPAMGKTTLMLQKILNEPGRRSYIFSPEIHAKKLIDRMEHILYTALSKEEYKQFNCHPGKYLASLEIYICECNIGIDELCDELKSVEGDIYIDYLQMLRPEGKTYPDRYESEFTIGGLSYLAEKHAVTVFSQINPIVEVRESHCPTIEDFRFFEMQVPMYADKVSVFYSNEYYTGEIDDIHRSVFRFRILKPAENNNENDSGEIKLIRTALKEIFYCENGRYWYGESRPVFFAEDDGAKNGHGVK